MITHILEPTHLSINSKTECQYVDSSNILNMLDIDIPNGSNCDAMSGVTQDSNSSLVPVQFEALGDLNSLKSWQVRELN